MPVLILFAMLIGAIFGPPVYFIYRDVEADERLDNRR